jgi:hypothetical protein
MVQFIDLLVECEGIARRFRNSIADAVRTIEAGSIEARRRLFGGLLADSCEANR